MGERGAAETDDRELTVYWHDAVTEYRPPEGAYFSESSDLLAAEEPHPEKPERVENVKRAIEQTLVEHVRWETPKPATDEQLEAVHESAYLEELEAAAAEPGYITPTTWLDEATLAAARVAAGASIETGARALADGGPTYALVRPSGHHAQPDRPDGYCYLNNAALAVEHAIRTGGADRVVVVDWDVHHGNGTQECFYDRDDVLVVSIHNDHGAWHQEYHPQTGLPDERGTGDGEGYTVNVPVPAGTGDEGYGLVFERLVEPVVEAFDPDLLVVSAGQDGGTVDPQGRNLLTKDGFEGLGRRSRRLADDHANGALAILQEGGYQQSHLAYATLGVLEGVLDVDTGVEDPFVTWIEDTDPTEAALEELVDAHAPYWPVLNEL